MEDYRPQLSCLSWRIEQWFTHQVKFWSGKYEGKSSVGNILSLHVLYANPVDAQQIMYGLASAADSLPDCSSQALQNNYVVKK